MGSFTVRREVAAPAGQVWAALVDWPSHSRWVPLTRVHVSTPAPWGLGTAFVTRTGVGPVGFDDPMTVTVWEPPADGRPGRCVLHKTGRVVRGGAELVVRPLGPDRSRVEWAETLDVVGVRRLPFAARVEAVAGSVVFGRVVRLMAREVTGRQDRRP